MNELLMIGALICLVEFLVAFGVGYATQRFFTSIVFVTLINFALTTPFLFYALILGVPIFVFSLLGAGFGSSIASSRSRNRKEKEEQFLMNALKDFQATRED